MSRTLLKFSIYCVNSVKLKLRNLYSTTHVLSKQYGIAAIDRFDNASVQSSTFSVIEKRNMATSHDAAIAAHLEYLMEIKAKRMEQQEFIEQSLANNKPLTSEEWICLKNKVFEMSDNINSSNFDAFLMNVCCILKLLNVGISYVEYLQSTKQEMNLATVSNFLKLCFVCRQEKAVDERMILSLYGCLKSKYEIFDSYSAENLLLGLSVTSKWEECIELLEMVKETAVPSVTTYSAVSAAAFSNGRDDMGWHYMEEALQNERKPDPDAYHAWLHFCEKNENAGCVNQVEKLLSFFKNHDIKPSKDVILRIQSVFDKVSTHRDRWQSSLTTLNNRGVCMACFKPLLRTAVTTEEFERLRNSFFNTVIIGSDVFQKTDPKEVEYFKGFLSNSKPYNLVCDGLNIAHSVKKDFKKTSVMAQVLHDVVQHCIKHNKSVLVLGRKHMQSWPRFYMDYIYENAQVFLANNLSHDDPFLLYATLYGGPDTCFLSRDLMRTYAFILKEKDLNLIFRRWQQQHQYSLEYYMRTRKVFLKYPLQFDPSPQHDNEGSWHIPYDEEYCQHPPETLDPPSLWFCLRKAKNLRR